MNLKKYLETLVRGMKEKRKDLETKLEKTGSIEEARSIGEQLKNLRDEINAAEEQLENIDDDDGGDGDDDSRGKPQEGEKRGFDPTQTYGNMQTVGSFDLEGRGKEEEPFSSVEYRKAFKEYVQRGTPISQELITRAGGDTGTTVTDDIGAIIPNTIMNEFIKEAAKVYGQIYSKVRKLNVKGGVKFPISRLKANFKWISETKVSEKQKAGEIKEFVEFSYNIGEIRMSTTLLATIVSLAMFEQEVVKIMLEAFLEAMDKGIIAGTGSGELLGITKDTRVKNVVEMSESDISNWEMWRKNLFSEIPLSKRGQGEFLFPSATVESYLLTMKDKNNRPIYKEATELTVGTDGGKFYGRQITLVEPDVIQDFATAKVGDIVGIYWIPNDYAINTNMEFGIKRYFDENTNEWIDKALVIIDGKILDTTGCYLIKKAAEATP